MFRSIRIPLARVRPVSVSRTFYRPLAVAARVSINPAVSPELGATASLLEDEPKGPNVFTDIPGPKARAAKDAMGKIQDVFPPVATTDI